MLGFLMATRDRPTLRRGGRFDPSVTADRLEQLRNLAGVDPKEIGSVLWPSQKPDNAARSWFKRSTQKRQAFSLPEIERAVDYLAAQAQKKGRIKRPDLTGFPFVDLVTARRIDTEIG